MLSAITLGEENFEKVSSWGTSLEVSELGKLLVIVGLLIAGTGALLWAGVGRGWFGRLPGDVNYSKGNFSFHFPIVTCLLISVVLTLLLWIFRKH